MKVALINPPYKLNIIRRWYCSTITNHYLLPPLELIYIGGILKNKRNIELTLIDCVAKRINRHKLIERLKQFKPDYIIFIPGFQTINEDMLIMQNVRERLSCKLICFGYYPTLFSKEILGKYNVDIIIIGEPELTISKIIDGKRLNRIDGISYKEKGKIRINKSSKKSKNIDNLPYPDRSLLQNNLYSTPFPDKGPITTLLTSRGCIHRCNYCISSNISLRERKIDKVMGEIDECVNKFGIKTFRLIDEAFTINRERVIEFCNLLIKKRYKIQWACLSRPENLDERLLRKMKKSGCKRILVGVESGSNKILDYYGRYYDLKKLKYLFKIMKRVGITSLAFFLIGAPIESKEDIKKSVKFSKEIDPDFIFVDVLTPVPGTYLYNKLRKEKKIDFSLIPYNIEYKSRLSKKELQKQVIKFYMYFYLRPSYLKNIFFWFLVSPRFLIKLFLTLIDFKKRKFISSYN